MAEVNLPAGYMRRSAASPQADSDLYAVEVLERDDERGRVRVHYTGFSRRYDEWKEAADIVPLCEEKG